MSFKTQIAALLKTQFPGVQLSEARIAAIAAKADAKVTKEDEIEAVLNDFNEIMDFAELAKQDDRIRSLEAEAKKKPAPTTPPAQPTPPSTPTEPDPKNPNTPTTDPALLALLAELKTGLSELKGEKIATDRKSKLAEKLKGAPEAYRNAELRKFSRMTFATDEEFDEFLTETETDVAAVIQISAEDGIGGDTPPASAAGGQKVKLASKAELDEVMENIKI